MEEKCSKEIRLPIWLVTAAIAIAITLIGFMWRQSTIQGRVIEQIERLRYDVDMLNLRTRSIEKAAVNRFEMDRVYNQLDRIEEYLKRNENPKGNK